ncbi:hypothetical protein [Nocardioides sp.]|uniref:hypothetical protein n=1 Tax=Nocardioides sp. TaxID=35761 RepID=UPI002ED57C36
MTSSLPVSACVAWHATSWLRGHEPADELTSFGLDLDQLAGLRRSGADGVGIALPRAGDLLGLGGPRELNAAALSVGEAVVGRGIALVPRRQGSALWWEQYDAAPRQVPDLGEADRALRSETLSAAETLARLDVARWQPVLADEFLDLARPDELTGPAGIPAAAVALAGRAGRVLRIAGLGLADDGGAIGSAEMSARREALASLERAARRALVAACSADVWPPA